MYGERPFTLIMLEKVCEPISVVCVYDRIGCKILPAKLKWNGKVYMITKLGFHHKTKQGQTIQHIFSVSTDSMFFRLRLDTDTLYWYLEEVSDGLAS